MLAHGQDRHGNFIHVPAPTENFAPDAVALYEDIRLAQAQSMMKGAAGNTEIYA